MFEMSHRVFDLLRVTNKSRHSQIASIVYGCHNCGSVWILYRLVTVRASSMTPICCVVSPATGTNKITLFGIVFGRVVTKTRWILFCRSIPFSEVLYDSMKTFCSTRFPIQKGVLALILISVWASDRGVWWKSPIETNTCEKREIMKVTLYSVNYLPE